MLIRRLRALIPWLVLGSACLAQVLVVPGGKPPGPELSPAEHAALQAAFDHYFGKPGAMDDFTTFTESLAKRGRPAIFAISSNLARTNAYLVFRQDRGADVLILRDLASDYQLLNSRHNGYVDIRLKAYMGIHTMVSTWRYDGSTYRLVTCIDHNENDGSANAAPLNFCGDNS
jgi:hypothetical protein